MSLPDSVDSEKERRVILDGFDPVEVLNGLPQTVFPVTAQVELSRSSGTDITDTTFRPPEYPVPLRKPIDAPYIPPTTIHFDNPAERPPDRQSAWKPREFVDRFEEVLTHLEEETGTDPDRTSLAGFCAVEIPPRYLTSDSGRPVAKPALYEEEGEMTMLYFQQSSGFTAHMVREELGDALPGKKRSPLQLTRIDEVVAKPSRASRDTRMEAGRAQYYTESEAEKAGKRESVPGIWKLSSTTYSGDSARPLDGVLTDLDQFAPAFADADLLKHVTFRGRTQEQEKFYAEQVLSQ